MATTAKKQTPSAPSRPSLSRMREIKSAATAPSTPKAPPKPKAAPQQAPKVVGKRKAPKGNVPAAPSRPSLAKMQSLKKQVAPKTRKRSATGSAPKVTLAGRHVAPNLRYKTGYWRPVRQSWMTDEVWAAVKAINRFKNKMMSKGLSKASLEIGRAHV